MQKLKLLLIVITLAFFGCNDNLTDNSINNSSNNNSSSGSFIEINNATTFLAFRDSVNKGNNNANAKLTNDIVLDNKTEFKQIKSYFGTFDGNGYTISGLNISDNKSDNNSMFGNIGYGAVVKDLHVSGVTVTGNYFVGVIAGRNYGTITNVHVDNVTVIGNKYVGSIVGQNDGIISASYATNINVSSTASDAIIGGIVGKDTGTLLAVYVDGGMITANGEFAEIGGIAGNSSGKVTSCYANVGMTYSLPNNGTVGGIVGLRDGMTIANNWFSDTMSQDFGDETNMNRGDITSVAVIDSLNAPLEYFMYGYALVDNKTILLQKEFIPQLNDVIFRDGIYHVGSETGLQTIRDYINAGNNNIHVKLTADIVFADPDPFINYNWLPINDFNGVFDGDNYTVKNLNTPAEGGGSLGFFSKVLQGGIVKNFGIIDFWADGDSIIGTIAGHNAGTILSVYADNTSIGGSDYVGGLVGENDGLILASYVKDSIVIGNARNGFYGGIAGANKGDIVACYIYGSTNPFELDIRDNNVRVGGIAGVHDGGNLIANYVAGLEIIKKRYSYFNIGAIAGRTASGTKVDSNFFFFVHDDSNNDITDGIGNANFTGIASNDNATELLSMLELNDNVTIMNKAIDNYDNKSGGNVINYRYVVDESLPPVLVLK